MHTYDVHIHDVHLVPPLPQQVHLNDYFMRCDTRFSTVEETGSVSRVLSPPRLDNS